MKRGNHSILLGAALFAAGSIGMTCSLAAADYSKEIASVKAGKTAEAHAFWWGFQKEDSTRALQAAMNSGAKKVIIDKQASDWVIGHLDVPSNIEIVIRDGVVIRAKKGVWEYKFGRHIRQHAMFDITRQKNVILRGEGHAKIIFPVSEQKDHRHSVQICDSDGVTVKNLEIDHGGGDCVYVGSANCRNVVLENLKCHHGWRQGLSVTGCDNLVVRNCTFNDTKGTAPQCGIDLEPNYPDGKTGLTRILFENCEFNRNELCGFYVANNSKQKIDLVIRNCEFRDNKNGGFITGHIGHPETPNTNARGRIVLSNCRFSGNRHYQVALTHYMPGVTQIIENCTIDTRNGGKTAGLSVSNSTKENIRDLVIRNLTVIDDENRPPVLFNSRYGNGLVNPVVENVTIKNSKGVKRSFNIAQFIAKAKPDPLAQKFQVVIPDFKKVGPAFKRGISSGNDLRFREKSEYVMYAEPGDVVKLVFTYKPVHRFVEARLPHTVTVHSPTINDIDRFKIDYEKSYTYTLKAEEKGIYRFTMDAGTQTFSVVSDRAGAMRADEKLYVFGCSGMLYFAVPAGVRDVMVELNGSPREAANGWLYNAQGDVVDSAVKLEGGKILVGKRADASKFEVWALRLAVAKSWVRLGAPLLPFLSFDPANLLVLKEQAGKYSSKLSPKLQKTPGFRDNRIVRNGDFALTGPSKGNFRNSANPKSPVFFSAYRAEMLTDDKGINSICLKSYLWHYLNLPAEGGKLSGEIVASGRGKFTAWLSTDRTNAKKFSHKKRLPVFGPYTLTDKPQSFKFEIETIPGERGYLYIDGNGAEVIIKSIEMHKK